MGKSADIPFSFAGALDTERMFTGRTCRAKRPATGRLPPNMSCIGAIYARLVQTRLHCMIWALRDVIVSLISPFAFPDFFPPYSLTQNRKRNMSCINTAPCTKAENRRKHNRSERKDPVVFQNLVGGRDVLALPL